MTERLEAGRAPNRPKPRLPREGLPSERPRLTAERQARLNSELLDYANVGNNKEVMRLLELGAEINATDAGGWTALHYAAWCGNSETYALLIEHGADINARGNMTNRTPLQIAFFGSKNPDPEKWAIAEAHMMIIANPEQSKAFIAAFQECINK
jgi:ankyrin repeat protein